MRIARACRELGIEAVAAYEPAERGALHVEVADDAVEVAGYLDAEALVAAAARPAPTPSTPATASWPRARSSPRPWPRPGWCSSARRRRALRAAGDKIEARRLAEAAGIPVTPGYAGVDLDRRHARAGGAPARLPAAW